MLEVLGVDYTVALASFFLWTALYNLAPILCGLLLRSVPEYAAASPAGKMTVQVSLVSTTHALVVVQGALRALQDPALAADHVWGQSALAEFYCKVAIGYFVWDTSICILNFKDYGVGFLVCVSVLCEETSSWFTKSDVSSVICSQSPKGRASFCFTLVCFCSGSSVPPS
eukprot:TRINITY_DN7478_c0_g1_i3.p1 TRINITY_DN7478_c0_g1~~TRINITY_DN7478_c0_g1_i3.p1  ORF type:complete len:185 (-),score=43.21 TRINITY_DN7478_c0_g1_i3:338-847(-)